MKVSSRSGARERLAAAALVLGCSPAFADLTDPQLLDQLAPLERAAALANQAVYDGLTGGQTPVCADQQRAPSGACSGVVFQMFENVRELVHTANELDDSGPTTFSLGLDAENLGFALRWTAAEELAAQGSSATDFSNSQLGTLSTRLAALRFGARGARTARVNGASGSRVVFSGELPLGGGAAAHEQSIARPWSVFLDGSFGYGGKDDTTFVGGFEDAFDYEGTEATVGADYRIGPAFVVGAMLGYTDRAIDFDSTLSMVDARIDSDGVSVMLYGLWEAEHGYLSASLGMQQLQHEVVRRILYPSFNPLVPSVDTTALSDTDSDAIIASFGMGLEARRGAFTFSPYLKGELQDIDIDGFTEGAADGFTLTYGSQRIESFDVAVGMKLQYVLTPSFGVVVPFVRGEYHKELHNGGSRRISATYAGLEALDAVLPAADFSIPTDRADAHYYQVAGGCSLVLRRGLQGFVQYQQILELDTFTDRAIAAGIRWEL